MTERIFNQSEGLTPDELFEFLRPRIEAYVTERFVTFHNGLIERDQISPPSSASQIVCGDIKPKSKLEVVKND